AFFSSAGSRPIGLDNDRVTHDVDYGSFTTVRSSCKKTNAFFSWVQAERPLTERRGRGQSRTEEGSMGPCPKVYADKGEGSGREIAYTFMSGTIENHFCLRRCKLFGDFFVVASMIDING
ncbi:hypothetical protein KI387_018496, partial [Taxus chinensis]